MVRYFILTRHYIHFFLKNTIYSAEDDIPGSSDVHSILSSLWEVRSEKLRNSMLTITTCPDAVSCANMSALEINTIKPLFCKSLDKLYELRSDRSTNKESEETLSDVPTQQPTEPKLRSLRNRK